MDNITYGKGLEIVAESEREYKKQRNLYESKTQELTSVERTIRVIKESISELTKKISSIDDIKRESILDAEDTYSREMSRAERVLKETNSSIDNSQAEDLEVQTSISADCQARINDSYIKVERAKEELENTEIMSVEAQRRCDELEEQIINSSLEDNQIKLCAVHIASNYDNVTNNAKFIEDFRDPRGAHPEDAQKKFASLSSKKIKRIASKMNSGAYVSSPDESRGLPILEILVMALTTLWMVIKGIFKGICVLYRPIHRFYEVTHKLIYGAVVTILLLLLFIFISSRFGDGIVAVLFILLMVLIATFIGMILFNVIKYGNKAFRKEQNLEYYTVGYYFTYRKDEIMYKIASEYYTFLKTKNPDELERILQTTFGVLKEQKAGAEQEREEWQARLSNSQTVLEEVEAQFRGEKEQFERQRDSTIEQKLKELGDSRVTRRESAKKLYDETVANIARKKENSIANAEKNAVDTLARRKQEISDKENELQSVINEQNAIREELSEIAKKAALALEQNNKMAEEYKSKNISVVQRRAENDQLPGILVAGLTGCNYTNLVSGRTERIYSQCEMAHEKKPIIITCDIEDDESKIVTESYYSFIDSLIGDLLGKTYIGAFRFVLVDSQGNKSGIVRCMETCRDSFDDLERFGCVKIMNDRTDKCFDEIIREQEKLLDGKSIDAVNESKKNLDNMVKYNFLCIRIYGKKSGDFTIGDFRKRIDNSLNNGVIPIVIMSQSYFEDKRGELEGTIRELCDKRYYKLGLNCSDNGIVKEVNFIKERI